MKPVKHLIGLIKQMIACLKEKGYDRVHTSGGTSLDGSHYAGIIGYDYDNSTKEFSFVGLPYNSIYHRSHDEDESNHTKRAGETPMDTAIREFFEETGLKAKPEDLVSILDYSIKDNRPGKEGQKHHKHFYMVNIKKCSGELASFEGPNPIDGETAAPILMPASLFSELLFIGHQQAFKKAVEKLSENRDYAYSLMNICNA